MDKLTIRDIDVRDKRVLVRVDFNVPMNEDTGEITDDSRIRASLPTIQYLIDHKAIVILCSHLGRPKGAPEEKFRLAPVAKRLSEMLGKPVGITRDCIGSEAEKAVEALKSGDILLLENLRFHTEEEKMGMILPALSPASLMSTSMTLLGRLIGRMPQLSALPNICRRWQAFCWEKNW